MKGSASGGGRRGGDRRAKQWRGRRLARESGLLERRLAAAVTPNGAGPVLGRQRALIGWYGNDKDLFAFIAEGPRAHGIDVAVVGYTLAPDVRLTDIVGEIRQALSVLRDRADEFGFDRDRLFVGGWSAGGHLTAIVSGHPAFRGGLPISGIFDLEPIALNYLNEKLALDASEIATLSPLRVLGDRSPPLRLFVGSDELPELRRQSAGYAQAARERGLPVALTVLPARHHYSILDELARPDGAITRALVELVEESARNRG